MTAPGNGPDGWQGNETMIRHTPGNWSAVNMTATGTGPGGQEDVNLTPPSGSHGQGSAGQQTPGNILSDILGRLEEIFSRKS